MAMDMVVAGMAAVVIGTAAVIGTALAGTVVEAAGIMVVTVAAGELDPQ
jgi:hypothetical protein